MRFLSGQAYRVQQKCKTCEKIDAKYRRKHGELDRLQRWMREPGRYKASIEKSKGMIKDINREIADLEEDRTRKNYSNVGRGC